MGSSPAEAGGLCFESTGEIIDPGMSAADFAATRLATRGSMHLGASRTEIKFPSERVRGAIFHTTLRFEGQRLAEIELLMLESEHGERWPEWNYENEMSRKAAHERWAAGVFGRQVELLPYPGSERVLPAEPSPEHARGAAFDWGRVGSYYDGKAGAAWLVVRYAEHARPRAPAAYRHRMITPQQAEAFAESWYAAWNAHDLDAIMAHYAPAIEHSSPFIKRYNGTDDVAIRGIEAVRDYFGRALVRNPSLRFIADRVAVGLESVVLIYRRMEGELAAETFFLDHSGKITRSVSHYG